MDWARRAVSWLGKAKLLLWLVGTILVVLVALWLFGYSEPAFRYVGFVLQFIGLVSVLLGIDQTRELFGKSSLLKSATTWLKSHLRTRKGEHVTLEIADSTHGQFVSNVVLRQHAGADAGIEDRLRVLESDFESLDSRTRQIQEQIDQANHDSAKALAAERQERERQVDDLNRKLELTETGGLDLSLRGLFWLAFGLFLSTASQELSRLF